jgi:hypothetical protein
MKIVSTLMTMMMNGIGVTDFSSNRTIGIAGDHVNDCIKIGDITMKRTILVALTILSFTFTIQPVSADNLYWLANKMVNKNIDITSLFKNVPKGSIVAILPKYAPQVCDYKSQITEYKNKLYSVSSCVYIGSIRKIN